MSRAEQFNPNGDLYQAFLGQIDIGVFATDENGRVIFWNQALVRVTGLQEDDLRNEFAWDVHFKMTAPEACTPETYTRFKSLFQQALQHGRFDLSAKSVVYDHIHLDGRHFFLEGQVYVIKTARGNCLLSLIRDVTARRKAENALRASEQKFRSVVEQAKDGILIVDSQETILEWNSGCELITGFSRNEAIGEKLSQLFPNLFYQQSWILEDAPESLHEQLSRALERVFALERVQAIEGQIEHSNGSKRWVQAVIFPIQTEDMLLFGGIARDLTAFKESENRLARYTRQMETLRQVGLEIAAELGLDALVWMIAPRAVELLNGTSMALYLHDPEKNTLELAISLGESYPKLLKSVQRGENLAGRVWDVGKSILMEDYHTGRTADLQRSFWGKVAGAPIVWGAEFLGVIFVFSDQAFYETDLKLLELFASHAAAAIRNARLHQELSQLAVTDALTGISNRRHFFDMAEVEFHLAKRFERQFSLIMFDLDMFKRVNDKYGHLIGDYILQVIVKRCMPIIRQTDIFARYGGEEFVVALPETTGEKALQLSERLRRMIADEPIETEKGPITVTASFGVVSSNQNTTQLMDVLNRVDRAMYTAKQMGRNTSFLLEDEDRES